MVLALAAAVAAGAVLFAVQRANATAVPAPQAEPSPDLVATGEQLYLTGCVSCHGVGGVGTDLGPTLVGVGAASADFYLTSGRMPAAQGTPAEPPRKQPAYSPDQIAALVAYVSTLGQGPAIPAVDLAGADVARGGVLFRANCASCHQSAGAGGALSYGQSAPDLKHATPTQVVEAMRIGPGQMPVFRRRHVRAAGRQRHRGVRAVPALARQPRRCRPRRQRTGAGGTGGARGRPRWPPGHQRVDRGGAPWPPHLTPAIRARLSPARVLRSGVMSPRQSGRRRSPSVSPSWLPSPWPSSTGAAANPKPRGCCSPSCWEASASAWRCGRSASCRKARSRRTGARSPPAPRTWPPSSTTSSKAAAGSPGAGSWPRWRPVR